MRSLWQPTAILGQADAELTKTVRHNTKHGQQARVSNEPVSQITAKDIACATLYLASDAAYFIGEILEVNGSSLLMTDPRSDVT